MSKGWILLFIFCAFLFGCSTLSGQPVRTISAPAPEFAKNSIPTKVQFLPREAQRASRMPASVETGQCVITNKVCPAYPTAPFVGTFVDFNTSVFVPQLQSFCSQRAQEYFAVCQEPAGSETTSTYYINGQKAQATTFPGTPMSWSPLSVSLQTTGGATYAYVTSYDGNIYQCSMDGGGNLNSCFSTLFLSGGGYVNSGTGISFFSAPSGITYAYFVVQQGPAGFYQCPLNSVSGTLSLSSCTVSSLGLPTALGYSISVGTFSGNTYAYVSSGSNDSLYQCPINANTGAIGACVPSVGGLDVSFGTFGSSTYAYVGAIAQGGVLEQCAVNSSSGVISNCVQGNTGIGANLLNVSNNVVLNSFGGNAYAFIANGDGFIPNVPESTFIKLLQCPLSNTGAIGDCFSNTGNLPNDFAVSSLAFNTTCSNPVAYVAGGLNDQGYPRGLYQCSVNPNTGALSGCTTAGRSL